MFNFLYIALTEITNEHHLSSESSRKPISLQYHLNVDQHVIPMATCCDMSSRLLLTRRPLSAFQTSQMMFSSMARNFETYDLPFQVTETSAFSVIDTDIQIIANYKLIFTKGKIYFVENCTTRN